MPPSRRRIEAQVSQLDRGDLEAFVMKLVDHCYWDDENEVYDEDKECPGGDTVDALLTAIHELGIEVAAPARR